MCDEKITPTLKGFRKNMEVHVPTSGAVQCLWGTRWMKVETVGNDIADVINKKEGPTNFQQTYDVGFPYLFSLENSGRNEEPPKNLNFIGLFFFWRFTRGFLEGAIASLKSMSNFIHYSSIFNPNKQPTLQGLTIRLISVGDRVRYPGKVKGTRGRFRWRRSTPWSSSICQWSRGSIMRHGTKCKAKLVDSDAVFIIIIIIITIICIYIYTWYMMCIYIYIYYLCYIIKQKLCIFIYVSKSSQSYGTAWNFRHAAAKYYSSCQEVFDIAWWGDRHDFEA